MRYDTLIVGAGSAGAILAARLSEDPRRSVCLIEAGPDYTTVDALPDRVRTHLNRRTFGDIPPDAYDWRFSARATAVQPEMRVPRGRVVGGSSSINGLVFLRALRQDLDSWAAAGNPGWGYDDCLPFFRRLESDRDFDDNIHGTSGPIPVSRAAREDWVPISHAFYEACTDLGFADCPDMNQPDARGVGPIPVNYMNDVRYSTAIGYLMPARSCANLTVLCDTLVHNIRFDGRRARAVRVVTDGQLTEIEADEIILSAGGIGSPHLLLLSGVGPADKLTAQGITPLADLPGVGQHLRDHPYVTTVWDGTARAPAKFPPPGLAYQLQLRATVPGSDLQDDLWITMITDRGASENQPRFVIPSSLIYARSAGEVTLASSDPTVAPSIDFNYFSDPSDLPRLHEIARLATTIGRHHAFDGVRARLVEPTSAVLDSPTAFADWAQHNVGTGHHASCTCRMGPASDRMAVVDATGAVHGLENLRVIDASIMPDCPSVNLNATVMMMAEKLADVIQSKSR